jgi:hypothetical protein
MHWAACIGDVTCIAKVAVLHETRGNCIYKLEFKEDRAAQRPWRVGLQLGCIAFLGQGGGYDLLRLKETDNR